MSGFPSFQDNDENEYRGLTKLVQHAVNRGSSNLRKGAASNIFYMVWLYLSPTLLGKRGYFTCSYKISNLMAARGRGGRSHHPVVQMQIQFTIF